MVGCTGEGTIAGELLDESNHSVLVVTFSATRFRFHTTGFADTTNAQEAGQFIGQQIRSMISERSKALFLFPCGLQTIVDDLMESLQQQIETELPILGGLAGDNHLRNLTLQFHDWKIYQGGVSAALIEGDVEIAFGASHGCVPMGLSKTITKIENNILYELDHKPALDVLAEYVGPKLRSDFGSVSLHMCLGQPKQQGAQDAQQPVLIRYLAKHLPDEQAICLPTKMNPGEEIRLMFRDREKMLQAAKQSICDLKHQSQGRKPLFALVFDCAGRGKAVLSEEEKHKLNRVFRQEFDEDLPWLGFFTYGEFCPINGLNQFHNFTAVVVLFLQPGGDS